MLGFATLVVSCVAILDGAGGDAEGRPVVVVWLAIDSAEVPSLQTSLG